ncbi:hypothetical protein XACLE20_1790008 [Xanthomonas citri pv. citri]|nr:hypothetical protein XACLE20_1790008 [Xanthomonas citri pv. citri]CEH60895.1 hypothetical protein XACLE3_9030008 [Xanthomonas citri pv. citri]
METGLSGHPGSVTETNHSRDPMLASA